MVQRFTYSYMEVAYIFIPLLLDSVLRYNNVFVSIVQGFRQQALAVSTDPEHRFELAVQLGELKTAYQLALEAEVRTLHCIDLHPSTFSYCTYLKPKYPACLLGHIDLLTSLEQVVIRERSCSIKVPPISIMSDLFTAEHLIFAT